MERNVKPILPRRTVAEENATGNVLLVRRFHKEDRGYGTELVILRNGRGDLYEIRNQDLDAPNLLGPQRAKSRFSNNHLVKTVDLQYDSGRDAKKKSANEHLSRVPESDIPDTPYALEPSYPKPDVVRLNFYHRA